MYCSWQANSGWKAWEVSTAQQLKEMTKLRTSGKELRTRWRCFVPDTCLWGPLYQQPEFAVSCHPWKLLLVASPTKSSRKPYITVYHSESRHHKPWWKSSKKVGCYTCTDLPLFVNFNSEPKIALPDTKTVKSECFQTKGQRGVSHENRLHLKRQLLQAANWCNEIWKNRGPHWPIEQVYQFHALYLKYKHHNTEILVFFCTCFLVLTFQWLECHRVNWFHDLLSPRMACSSCSCLRLLAGELAFFASATTTDWVESTVEVTT